MFEDACLAGISPLEFDQMYPWQVMGAIRGFDQRLRFQTQIQDALVYKLIRGMSWDKPKLVPFDRLFPQWAQETPREKTPEEIARINARRLAEWCDLEEEGGEMTGNHR